MEVSLLFPILGIIILILLSAFFSGSETAFTAASTVRLTAREKAGSKQAALVNKIRLRKDKLIGALLLGNNLVNILASALATSVLIKIFGEHGVLYATAIMTTLILIFAEVLPKTYALTFADRLAMRTARIIQIIIWVFAPVTEAVTWLIDMILRMFGVNLSQVKKGSHLELLRGAIDMHQGKTKKTQEQRSMLKSILDLFDVRIENIMTHRQSVDMIDSDQNITDIITVALNSMYTRLPLWQGDTDNIVGVIHLKNVLKAIHDANGDYSKVSLDDITMAPWYVPETTSLYDQLQEFRERKEHFAVVVDEYGSFMGIVTLEDILEEIVGEIEDEHDIDVAGVRKGKAGGYIIKGDVAIRDLNREMGWNLPDTEDYSTLAGLILFQSQIIPDEGQSFVFSNFRFDILEKKRNQIMVVRVVPPAVEIG